MLFYFMHNFLDVDYRRYCGTEWLAISMGSDDLILFQGVTGDRLAGGAAHLLHLFFFLPRPQHTM